MLELSMKPVVSFMVDESTKKPFYCVGSYPCDKYRYVPYYCQYGLVLESILAHTAFLHAILLYALYKRMFNTVVYVKEGLKSFSSLLKMGRADIIGNWHYCIFCLELRRFILEKYTLLKESYLIAPHISNFSDDNGMVIDVESIAVIYSVMRRVLNVRNIVRNNDSLGKVFGLRERGMYISRLYRAYTTLNILAVGPFLLAVLAFSAIFFSIFFCYW